MKIGNNRHRLRAHSLQFMLLEGQPLLNWLYRRFVIRAVH